MSEYAKKNIENQQTSDNYFHESDLILFLSFFLPFVSNFLISYTTPVSFF
jgi:hypothetical protein